MPEHPSLDRVRRDQAWSPLGIPCEPDCVMSKSRRQPAPPRTGIAAETAGSGTRKVGFGRIWRPQASRRAGEKLVLHKLRFHPDFVAPFSPPCEGGVRGVVPARPVTRSSHALSLSVVSHPSRVARRIVFDFQGSRITPPAPPLRKGGKGIARSRRHSIARNKNTRLETIPPARSTPTFHRATVTARGRAPVSPAVIRSLRPRRPVRRRRFPSWPSRSALSGRWVCSTCT